MVLRVVTEEEEEEEEEEEKEEGCLHNVSDGYIHLLLHV